MTTNIIKNLEQLEKEFRLLKRRQVKSVARFASADKENIQDFRKKFNSLNFQTSSEDPTILISEEISQTAAHLLKPYVLAMHENQYDKVGDIKKIPYETAKRMTVSEFMDLESKQVVMDFLYCENFEENFEHFLSHSRLKMRKPFNPDLLKHIDNSVPQEIYEGLYNEIKKNQHADYLLMKHQNPIKGILNVERKGGDNLDSMIYDIVSFLNNICFDGFDEYLLEDKPSLALSYYIKNTVSDEDTAYLVILINYIQNKYKITSDFLCETDPQENTHSWRNHLALPGITSNIDDNLYILADDLDSEDTIDLLFKSFISAIIGVAHTLILTYYSKRNLKKAYEKALKEDKTILELQRDVEAINEQQTARKQVETAITLLNYSEEQVKELIETVPHIFGENASFLDENQEDYDVNVSSQEMIDLENNNLDND